MDTSIAATTSANGRNRWSPARPSSKGPLKRPTPFVPSLGRLPASVVATITAIGILSCLGLRFAAAQGSESNEKWRTGSELREFNQLAISSSWNGVQLRNRLALFADHQRIGVFLDRRVNPFRPVDLSVHDVTIEQFYWSLAEKCEIGVCELGDLYYFGPPQVTAVLPMLWKELEKETSKNRRESTVEWGHAESLKTEIVVEPKQLLQQLANDHQFQIENLESLPHDVWAGFELPPMSLDTRVATILIGFDKWFTRSADGQTIRIIDLPFPDSGQLVVNDLDGAKQIAAKMKAEFPNLKIRATSKSLTGRGSPEALAALKRKLVMLQQPVIGEKRFGLGLRDATRINVLNTIAKDTGIRLVIATSSRDELEARITFKVTDVTLDGLISEVLKGSSLHFELAGGTLTISDQ